MNILHITGMNYPTKFGGLERWFCALSAEGQKHGHQISIAYHQSIGNVSVYQEQISSTGGQLILLETPNQILSYCIDNAVDAVHFHFDFPEPGYLYRQLHRNGCMLFQHFHCECGYHIHRQWQHHPIQFIRVTYHRAKTRWYARYFAAFLGCCQTVAAQHQSFYFLSRRKTGHLYLGIPRQPTAPKDSTTPTVPTIVCTAFHSPIKGVDVLLDALAILKEQKVPFRLLQIGGGSSEINGKDTIQLHDQCHRLGLDDDVVWVGLTDHVDLYLGQADIYCQPSRTEAIGLSIMESMQHALPVVASNVGGIPELVHDGVNGFLVAPDAPYILAQKLKELLTYPALRRSMGQQSALILERLGLFQDLSAKQAMALYEKYTG